MTDHSFDGLAFRSGVRAAVPLGAPAIPFGLALGLVITDTPAVSSFTGWASSWVLYAGSDIPLCLVGGLIVLWVGGALGL